MQYKEYSIPENYSKVILTRNYRNAIVRIEPVSVPVVSHLPGLDLIEGPQHLSGIPTYYTFFKQPASMYYGLSIIISEWHEKTGSFDQRSHTLAIFDRDLVDQVISYLVKHQGMCSMFRIMGYIDGLDPDAIVHHRVIDDEHDFKFSM